MVRTTWSVAPGLPPLAVPVRSIPYHALFWALVVNNLKCRDLETRKQMRERAWESDGWADTVHKARPGILVHSRPAHMIHRHHSWRGRWIHLS